MNRLELGKYWLARLCRVLPQASTRMITRMAWHLAALSVQTDEELLTVPNAALAQFAGGSRHFLELREQYLHARSLQLQSIVSAPAFARQARRGTAL
jgi:hypothetical protein